MPGGGAANDPDTLSVHHRAGASNVDELILVDSDADQDGVLEDRTCHVQNGRQDVFPLTNPRGNLIEQPEYGLYGNAIDLLSDVRS